MIDLIFLLIPIAVASIAASHTAYHQRWLDRHYCVENNLNDLRMELDRIERRMREEEGNPKAIPHTEPFPDEWEMESILFY